MERETGSSDLSLRTEGGTWEGISSGEWGGQTCVLVCPTSIPYACGMVAHKEAETREEAIVMSR